MLRVLLAPTDKVPPHTGFHPRTEWQTVQAESDDKALKGVIPTPRDPAKAHHVCVVDLLKNDFVTYTFASSVQEDSLCK